MTDIITSDTDQLLDDDCSSIDKKSLALLIESTTKIIFALPISVSLMCFFVRNNVALWVLGTWLLFTLLVSVGRFVIQNRIKKAMEGEPFKRKWLHQILLIDVLTGVSAGIPVTLLSYVEFELQMLLVIVCIGIATNAVVIHAASKKSFLAFVLAQAAVMTPSLLLSGDALLQVFAIFWMVNVGLLIANFKAANSFLINSLKMADKNANLAKQLQQSNNELSISRDEALGANETKSRFIASLSHEFRTPLNLILGPLEELSFAVKGDEKKEKQTKMIQRNANRLKHMVDQILNLTQFGAGNTERKHVYSVENTVNVMVDLFEHIVNEKGLQIALNTEPGLFVKMTSDSFEKILANLISNAIKYNQSGGNITLKTQDENGYLILTVSDTGIGINSEKVGEIFELFNRADMAENNPGNGIGLAIVKQLVEQNDGDISVESELGKGSAFVLKVPLCDETEAADGHYTNKTIVENLIEKYQANNPQDLVSDFKDLDDEAIAKPIVMVVEDNADMQTYLQSIFKEQFQTMFASDGVAALEKMEATIPDIILTDLMMPNMDGLELVNRIRGSELLCHIPIILLTARESIENRKKSLRSHVDDYIAKPFDREELLLRVHNMLELRKMLQRTYGMAVFNANCGKAAVASQVFEQEQDRHFMDRFHQVVEQNCANLEFTRADAAMAMNMSVQQLTRKLTALVDYSFSEYLKQVRLSKSHRLLAAGNSIEEVCREIGFIDQEYFAQCFRAQYGQTPAEYVASEAKSSL